MTKRQQDAITTEQLERTVQALAFIVLRHGEQYAELMDWADEELDQRQRAPSSRERAQRILRSRLQEVKHHVQEA